MLRIVQLNHPGKGRCVALVDEPHLRPLRDCHTVYELAQTAIREDKQLRAIIEERLGSDSLVYDAIYAGRADWRLLPPIDHPEPSRCYITGTGLTHKASADNRQSMHLEAGEPSAISRQPSAPNIEHPASSVPHPPLTDSMKMFQLGIAGGRPEPGCIGAAPEWFYKGTGHILRAHNEPLILPPHALDGGEEAEIAGVYLISPSPSARGGDAPTFPSASGGGARGEGSLPAGTPFRIGLTQANEFSDHVLESQNYLYLAGSKLRDCALGPELVIDAEFDDVPGRTTIERDGHVIWQAEQASGERHMCHSLANLEHHHFKHTAHCRPGDVHVHFLGADAFSFKDRLRLADGDVMQIAFDGFGRPLRNSIRRDDADESLVVVQPL